MAIINKGDLLQVKETQTMVVATSPDYSRRIGGTSMGEFLEDWTVVPGVDVLDPNTGVTGWYRLSQVRVITDR